MIIKIEPFGWFWILRKKLAAYFRGFCGVDALSVRVVRTDKRVSAVLQRLVVIEKNIRHLRGKISHLTVDRDKGG